VPPLLAAPGHISRLLCVAGILTVECWSRRDITPLVGRSRAEWLARRAVDDEFQIEIPVWQVHQVERVEGWLKFRCHNSGVFRPYAKRYQRSDAAKNGMNLKTQDVERENTKTSPLRADHHISK
jgi:hypothetical protein